MSIGCRKKNRLSVETGCKVQETVHQRQAGDRIHKEWAGVARVHCRTPRVVVQDDDWNAAPAQAADDPEGARIGPDNDRRGPHRIFRGFIHDTVSRLRRRESWLAVKAAPNMKRITGPKLLADAKPAK